MCKNASKNIVSIASVALNSLTAVLKITNLNNPDFAKYETDAATLLAQLAAWKSGSAADQVVEAIDLVISDVNLIPIDAKYQAVIAVALAGLASILAIVNENSQTGGKTQVASAAVMQKQQIEGPQYTGNRAAIYYSRDWNSSVGQHEELKHTKIPNREMLKELLP